MDALQGAALAVKLPRLDRWTAARQEIANAYHAGLSPWIARTKGPIGADHACHVYAIRVADRPAVQAALAERGVATGIHYPVPVHLQPAYAGLGYRAGDFPVAESLAREALSLPIYPEMTEQGAATVVDAVNAVMAQSMAKVA
jgi:dTDP-4-amino-4,6-dideoxygalactose transaminase